MIKKELTKINISDELMSALVQKLFDVPVINMQRNTQRILNSIDPKNIYTMPKNWPPDLSMTLNNKLVLDEKFRNLLWISDYDQIQYYVSLTSDNCINELQCFITEFDNSDGTFELDSLVNKTGYYEMIENKIFFYNN